MSEPVDIDELFARTLVGDLEDEQAWQAVRELRGLGSREVLQRAVDFTRSSDATKRARGADVLAQIGVTMGAHQHAFPSEAFAALQAMLAHETDESVISSALSAFHFIEDERAIDLLLQYADHPSAEIRYAAVFSLNAFPEHPNVIDALLQLMQDVDEDVRDWATFGVGCLVEQDSPEIRAALHLRLQDVCEDAAGEALSGLCRRQDISVLPRLIDSLQRDDAGSLILESAEWMLGFDCAPDGWGREEYLSALRRKFPEYFTAT